MRALLIVNPIATSTSRPSRDAIVRALARAVDLDEEQTRYPGHATALAAKARSEGYDVVFTLGGDGTVNEAVNGILGAPEPDGPPPPGELPALAALPGGSANVFTRALGLPRDPADAAEIVQRALADRRERVIGVGLDACHDRYFVLNAGIGFDAEVVRAVQELRTQGRRVTPALYVRTALRQFYRKIDRRHPALLIEANGAPVAGAAFAAMVLNTAPWTYLGSRAVQASPRASFDAGLDLLVLRSLGSVSTWRAVTQMLSGGRGPTGRGVLRVHDQAAITLRADRPVALQVDGEYVGERESAAFRSVQRALRVVA